MGYAEAHRSRRGSDEMSHQMQNRPYRHRLRMMADAAFALQNLATVSEFARGEKAPPG